MITILDCTTKVLEFNSYHSTTFRMCIATHWFGWGEKNMRANVKVERLNIAIKAATYHIIGCRLVQLDGITLVNTSKPTYNQLPSNRIMDLNITSRHGFVNDSLNYMRDSITGWDLDNYTNRRIREQLRQVLYNQGVISNWKFPGMIPKLPTITISRFLIKNLDAPRNRSEIDTHQILRG